MDNYTCKIKCDILKQVPSKRENTNEKYLLKERIKKCSLQTYLQSQNKVSANNLAVRQTQMWKLGN